MANVSGRTRRESRRFAIQQAVRDLVASPGRLPLLWGRRGFWQIRLRWLVAPVMLAGVALGRGLGFRFAVVPILVVAAASLAYNAVFAWIYSKHEARLRAEPQLDRLFTVLQVVADYLAMFLLIHFTGGAWSPLVVFLIFHVIIAAIQFSPGVAHLFAAWAAGGLWLLLFGETAGWLPRFAIVYRDQSMHFLDRPLYAAVMLLFFTATLFITASMVSTVMARLRFGVEELAVTSNELALANDKMNELMRERTQFMLEVAHNLRAPLSASLGNLELLRDGTLGDVNDKQVDHARRIEVRLRALHEMIGELLTIARLRDWSREIPDVVIDLGELAVFTELAFRDQAAGSGLRFSVVAEPDLPRVDSGANLLEQMMENLVSNAIKYTPRGGEVEVRVVRSSSDDVRIVVRDTGIGIPLEEQDKLFREFFRASNAKQHSTAGTGLGLTLVKQTVERHRGRMEITSAEGDGTTVEIEIPIHQYGREKAEAGSGELGAN